jgi:hypothetical protein
MIAVANSPISQFVLTPHSVLFRRTKNWSKSETSQEGVLFLERFQGQKIAYSNNYCSKAVTTITIIHIIALKSFRFQ